MDQSGTEIEVISKALLEGEASGEPIAFDAAAFKHRMLREHIA